MALAADRERTKRDDGRIHFAGSDYDCWVPSNVVTTAALFLLTCLSVAGQSDIEGRISHEAEAALQESGAPSVSIAVVREGKIWAKAFGNAHLEPSRPADLSTRYAIGSVSKQFTSTALLLLQEKGKVSLDDRVAKWFPELTRSGDVTIRQLLSHTSGYEDYAPQDYLIPEWTHPTTPEAVVDHWAKLPLNFEPGTKWQYSNTNYVIAGLIVEKVAGQTLLNVLKKEIFDPLDMPSAGFCDDRIPTDAGAYTRYALGPARPIERESAGWYFGAGELCMTAQDLAKWDVAFLHKQVLSERSYEEFTREVLLKNGDHTGYGLGLQVGRFHEIPFIHHGGEVMGFLAENQVYPNRQAAVVVLSNEVGVDMISPLTERIQGILLMPPQDEAPQAELDSVRKILEGLRQGTIDKSLFTSNANFYFATALADYKASLEPLGSLKTVKRNFEALRGGMKFRTYSLAFEKKSVTMTAYVRSDGKYEQLLVEGK